MKKKRTNRMPTFTVRFWANGTKKQIGWRGRVDHLQSGKVKMFNTVQDLLAFFDKNR